MRKRLTKIANTARRLLEHLGVSDPAQAPDGPATAILEVLASTYDGLEDAAIGDTVRITIVEAVDAARDLERRARKGDGSKPSLLSRRDTSSTRRARCSTKRFGEKRSRDDEIGAPLSVVAHRCCESGFGSSALGALKRAAAFFLWRCRPLCLTVAKHEWRAARQLPFLGVKRTRRDLSVCPLMTHSGHYPLQAENHLCALSRVRAFGEQPFATTFFIATGKLSGK